MKLAFALFKYFPYGGLQRDMLRLAEECHRRGHEITIYAREWQGEIPDGFAVRLLKPKTRSNHARALEFDRQLRQAVRQDRPALLIGFNRLSSLDVYFAADNCLQAWARHNRSWLYRRFPRYQAYQHLEAALFAPSSPTLIFSLTARQEQEYQHYYQTAPERFFRLPPGMPPDRRRTADAEAIRNAKRQEKGLQPHRRLILQVGSGFKAKGVARAIRAVAALPAAWRRQVSYQVAGRANPAALQKLARQLNVADQVKFLGPRDDIPALLQAADLMLHPAVNEAAATVLIESLAAGLPVLCSGATGYSEYIEAAGSGVVLPEPFDQTELDRQLARLLSGEALACYRRKALDFAAGHDLCNRHRVAADRIEQLLKERYEAVSG